MSVSTVMTLYLGSMGSGKSIEMLENWVLVALRAGYTVATSIKGVNPQAISAYLGIDVTNRIILLPDDPEELLKPQYWPTSNKVNPVIPPGCALCLDEVYKLLGNKPPAHVLEYFREQRHMTDADGRTGITALAFQHWSDVHRSIRGVADRMYHMSKFYALAPFMKFLRPLKLGADYRVAIYTVIKDPERAKPLAIKARRYNPAIFPLYKSHDSTDAAEFGGDSRSSIFSSKYISWFIPLGLAAAYYAGSFMFDKFGGAIADKPATTASQPVPVKNAANSPTAYNAVSAASPTALKAGAEFDANLSDSYRYVGRYTYNSLQLYVLQHKNGFYRYVSQPELKRIVLAGPAVQLELHDGTRITSFSGINATQSQQAPAPGPLANSASSVPK